MSSSLSSRLKVHPRPKLARSTSEVLVTKLQKEGSMPTIENALKKVEDMAKLLCTNLEAGDLKEDVYELSQTLKVYGAYLDLIFPEVLNRNFFVFRNLSQDEDRLDNVSRLYLLELIELRANNWKANDTTNQYYRKKANQLAQVEALETASSLTDSMMSHTSSTAPLLSPGEVLKPSGKFTKPTRITGKNYCKDEVVIRNADSGKVTPGAKERLVQITGANEESINHAKQLIEDTIRRNASPVREPGITGGAPLTGSSSSINSSASDDSALPPSARTSRTLLHSLSSNDASMGEYKYTVLVGNSVIKITGDNLEFVRQSKLVLDYFFSGEPIHDIGQFDSFDSFPRHTDESPISTPESPIITNGQINETPLGKHVYSIELLVRLAMSPLCLTQPKDWEYISAVHPNLIREEVETFNAQQYLSNRSSQYSNIVHTDNDIDGA